MILFSKIKLKANNGVKLLLAFGLLAACHSVQRDGAQAQTSSQKEPTFRLPDIPATLTVPEERANYLVAHYWDYFDFTDTLLIRSAVSEQAFVDYTSILPYVASDTAAASIRQMLISAEKEKSRKMLAYFLDLAEQYWYDGHSPLHNNEYYIPVAEYMLSDICTNATEKERLTYRLAQMMKNRIGETASDFTYRLPTGKTGRLHEIQSGYILLLFYNPECSVCEEWIAALQASPSVRSLQQAGKLTVLLFYPGRNEAAWKKQANLFPRVWINGQSIENPFPPYDELYDLNILPVLYLLDKDKKTLLKEVSPTVLEDKLQTLQ
ncbi:MAG: DUF5106 domain-containing protein [Candidatus Azobacteroides sp.]|nr:DUF5106 domain-containing protein [Candidatus Azobacteroides sp.]